MIIPPLRSPRRRHTLRAAGAVVSLWLLHQTASAVDGTWNVDANGTWSTTTNWLNNIVADGAGSTANFTFDITADRTVSLDTPRTVGNLNFTDPTVATAGSWILNNNATAANILTLQTALGTTPTISVATLGSGKSAFVQLVLAGNQGMTKAGAGILNLQGVNTYTGTTLVDAGTLTVSNAALSASTTGSILGSSLVNVRGTLILDNGNSSTTTADRIADSATVRVTSGGLLQVNAGTNGVTVTETVGSLSLANGYSTVSVVAGGGETGSSARSGRLAAGSIARTGNALTLVNATNLGSNTATIGASQTSSGRITFTDPSGLGLIGTAAATTGPGTTTNLQVVPWMYGNILGSVAAEANFQGNGLLTYDTNNGLRLLTTSETTTFAAAPSADTNVRESVTGGTAGTPVNKTVTLTGNTVANSVQLQDLNTVNASGNLTLDIGAGNTLRIASGALYTYNLVTNTTTIQNGSLTAGTTANSNGELILISAGAGGTTLTTPVVNNGSGVTSLTLGGSRGPTLAANNTFTGTLTVNTVNTTTTTLSGTNLFTAVNVNSGVLSASGASTLNGVPVAGINRGASLALPTTTGTNSTFQGINDIDGGGVLANANGGTAAATRTLLLSGPGTYAFSGVVQNQLTVGNSGVQLAISKTGTGTQTFSGANTYTGGTSVTGGTLLFNGNSSAATGTVTVGASGTLGGTGSIGGATTVNGTLLVGASTGATSVPGLLTFTNTGAALALAGTSLFDVNGAGTRGLAFDAVNVTGALTYGGALNISLNGFTPANNSTYDLFDFGSQSGTFSSIAITGGSYTGSLDYTTGVLTLSAVAVPEPSTWGATAVGLLLFAGYRLRRRRRMAA